MESTSFHLQHQLQEEFAQYATKSETNRSTSLAWIPSNIHDVSASRFATESITSLRELEPRFGMINSLRRTSSGKDFGVNDAKNLTQQYSSCGDLLAKFNDKVSDNLPKLCEMISSTSRAVNEPLSLLISTREPQQYSHNFFSGRGHVTGIELSPSEILYNVHEPVKGGITLSKSYNICGVSSSNSNLSTLDLPSSLVSCSLGLNYQQLDLHTSYGGGCGLQNSYHDAFDLNEGSIYLSHSNMQGRENSPSNSSNKISALNNGVARTKRAANSSAQPKESEGKAKKSRRSWPPLKVRKEKLGDRIQTLQRLVAPFGKTDTASVLTEAIGYIHFLHDQIQTLSVSYMKSSQSKPFRSVQLDSKEEDSRDSKSDLRSSGLRLVPLSYASIIHRCD